MRRHSTSRPPVRSLNSTLQRRSSLLQAVSKPRDVWSWNAAGSKTDSTQPYSQLCGAPTGYVSYEAA